MASKKNKKKKQPKKFRSGLETRFAELLNKNGVKAEYEPTRFAFQKLTHYTPDWRISDTFFVETKGYFSPSDRGNLLAFRDQNPSINIFLVFGRASNLLNRRSKTTYGKWAEKHGFPYCNITDTAVILNLFKQKEK